MRYILLIIGVIGFLSFRTFNNNDVKTSAINYSTVNCKIGQCQATAKSTDNRCKHCVSNSGDSYCWQHR